MYISNETIYYIIIFCISEWGDFHILSKALFEIYEGIIGYLHLIFKGREETALLTINTNMP